MADECNKKFAQRFKALRVGGGYTQQQIANLFHVTRPCICYWETGKRVPDYVKLVELCRFFNVSSDYMLGVSDVKTVKLSEGRIIYNIDDYIDMSKLSDEYRRQLLDYYQYLLDKQAKVCSGSVLHSDNSDSKF